MPARSSSRAEWCRNRGCVRQACEAPELAKSVQILFRGEHGLEVWSLETGGRTVSCGVVCWRDAGWEVGWVLCHCWREDP